MRGSHSRATIWSLFFLGCLWLLWAARPTPPTPESYTPHSLRIGRLAFRVSAFKAACPLFIPALQPRRPLSLNARSVGASVSALAGLGLAALVLDALGGAAWRRHQAAQMARPDSWEGLLREALKAWPPADVGMRAQLDSWAQQTPLPLTELKQWLAQERAVTPPM